MKTLLLTLILASLTACNSTPYSPLEAGCATIEFSGNQLITRSCGAEKKELVCSDTNLPAVVPHAGTFQRIDCA